VLGEGAEILTQGSVDTPRRAQRKRKGEKWQKAKGKGGRDDFSAGARRHIPSGAKEA